MSHITREYTQNVMMARRELNVLIDSFLSGDPENDEECVDFLKKIKEVMDTIYSNVAHTFIEENSNRITKLFIPLYQKHSDEDIEEYGKIATCENIIEKIALMEAGVDEDE